MLLKSPPTHVYLVCLQESSRSSKSFQISTNNLKKHTNICSANHCFPNCLSLLPFPTELLLFLWPTRPC